MQDKFKFLILILFFIALMEGVFFSLLLKGYAHDTTVYYQPAALNILNGKGYILDNQMPLSMPGYPLFMALVYKLFGANYDYVRAAQVILSALVTLIIFYTALEIGLAQKTAAIAASLSVLLPLFAMYASFISPEALSVFFTALLMLCLVRLIKRKSYPLFFLCGILLGINTLIRPEYLFFVILIMFLLLFIRPVKRGILGGALLLIAALAVLLPNSVIFYRHFGKALLVHHHGYSICEFNSRKNKPFYYWMNTWYGHPKYLYIPHLDNIDSFPAYAFDNEKEKAQVAALLSEWKVAVSSRGLPMQADYNIGLVEILPQMAQVSDGFIAMGESARRRHPVKVFLWRPLKLIFNTFLTSKTELLSSKSFPQALQERDLKTLLLKTSLFLLNAAVFFFSILGILFLLLNRRLREGYLWLCLPLLLLVFFRAAIILPMPNGPRMLLQAYISLYILAALGVSSLFTKWHSQRGQRAW